MAALEMTRAHNLMIRLLNAIYQQGPYVTKKEDVADFLFLGKCWVDITHHHHHVEETIFFPEVAKMSGKPELMGINLQQHQAFHDGMDEMERYCTTTTPEAFKWADMKAVIDAFAEPLMLHFRAEIPTILALREYDSDKVREIWAKVDKAATDSGGASAQEVVLPCALGCIDKTFEDGYHKDFPPIPWFVTLLITYVWSRKHRSVWRFLPCDFSRNPKPLAFTAETAKAS